MPVLVFVPPPLAHPAVGVSAALSWFPCPRLPVRHFRWSALSISSLWLSFRWAPHACCVACACDPAASASPPSPCLFARAFGDVPSQGAGRAVPGGPCPSPFPDPVPCSACLVCGGGGPVSVSPWRAFGRVPLGAGSVWPGQPVVLGGWVWGMGWCPFAGAGPAAAPPAGSCWARLPCAASGGVAASCYRQGGAWGVGGGGSRVAETPRLPAWRCAA